MTSSCLNWSQSSISQSSSSSSYSPQTLASAISSKRRSLTDVTFRNKLNRSRSYETLTSTRNPKFLKRVVSANFNSNFSNEINKFDIRFQSSNDDEFVSIERKANSVDLPFSLRIIQKKKKQFEKGMIEVKDYAYCSVKKAFSSMVFIINELQSYSLQMREMLFVEDLHEILIRVHKEMNASFVWLFQQVFSHTPTLMVYVMILLANYSVHSMTNDLSIAVELPHAVTVETVSTLVNTVNDQTVKFPGGVNGGGDGGGKALPVSNGGDGDGEVEELGLWKTVVAEAEKMQEVVGDGGSMVSFVAPVTVEMEDEYLKTEVDYKMGLMEEPDNPLLLANYAQFLYLFAHDHKRAEMYFKKASEIEPKDAEASSKYASFLWHAKNDLWAAEEIFLDAISVDPDNSFYTASYAHFLWSNGADDMCYPLDSPENVNSDEF